MYEVEAGRIADQNGPWVSEELLELGVDVAHITICGDRPADLTAQLRFLAVQRVDLIVTSGFKLGTSSVTSWVAI